MRQNQIYLKYKVFMFKVTVTASAGIGNGTEFQNVLAYLSSLLFSISLNIKFILKQNIHMGKDTKLPFYFPIEF